jgi:hypothetical protein
MEAVLDHGLTVVEIDRPQLAPSRGKSEQVSLVGPSGQVFEESFPALRSLGGSDSEDGRPPVRVARFNSSL